MESNSARIAVVAGGIALVVVLFLLFGSDDETSEPNAPAGAAPTVSNVPPSIEVKNGKPLGGVQELTYDKGDQIEFTVDSDTADEVHVHGYDLMEDVSEGGSVSFSFPAEIDGEFEVELEGSATELAEITVNP